MNEFNTVFFSGQTMVNAVRSDRAEADRLAAAHRGGAAIIYGWTSGLGIAKWSDGQLVQTW